MRLTIKLLVVKLKDHCLIFSGKIKHRKKTFTLIFLWRQHFTHPISEAMEECLEVDFGDASKSESDR